MNLTEIKKILDDKVLKYENKEFIKNDPIFIPHLFTEKQDIEIAGFIAAIFAWGNRKVIIKKCLDIFSKMGNRPYEYILNLKNADLSEFKYFKHRTIKDTDIVNIIKFLHHHYSKFASLEQAFFSDKEDIVIENCLIDFYEYFAKIIEYDKKTLRHISSPRKLSSCKRMNMYLRWMIRKNSPVDFGLWNRVSPSQLICPLDIHVGRTARKLNLIERKQNDWLTAIELTKLLRDFDPVDPIKYDFALFGVGVEQDQISLT